MPFFTETGELALLQLTDLIIPTSPGSLANIARYIGANLSYRELLRKTPH